MAVRTTVTLELILSLMPQLKVFTYIEGSASLTIYTVFTMSFLCCHFSSCQKAFSNLLVNSKGTILLVVTPISFYWALSL